MKAKRFFSVLAFLFVLSVLINCSGPSSGGTTVIVPPPPPPPPTPKAPVLTVDYPTDTVKYANTATFTWTLSGDPNANVTLNNNSVPKNGSYNTGKLFTSKDYKLVATGKGGSDSKSFTINVGDWSTSVFGLLTHNYWKVVTYGFQTDSSALANSEPVFVMFTPEQVINDSSMKELYDLTKDNRYKVYDTSNNNALLGDYAYTSTDSSFQVVGGDLYDIESLSKTRAILREHGTAGIDTTGNGIPDITVPTQIRWIWKRVDSK